VQDKTYQEVMRILTQPKLCESCHGSGSRSPIPSQFNGVCARCRGSGKAPPT
jgi:DnaJ-class molecular chaperone